ncbi:SRP19 protein [Novymonas esmeraldas]|uniref:SRP19 protein n=1 Tax=Novymonas esmeraldas TaxID=1808958 RepID=A0AAW0EWX6_9TRYP
MESAQPQPQPRPGLAQMAPRSYDKKAYQTIYPQYIDSYLSPSEGRRLTKTQGVEHPTMDEVLLALRVLGYKDVLVDAARSYPRSQSTTKFPMVPRGCIKVAIKTPVDEHYIKKSDFDTQTRNAVVAGIESKHELLRRVAALIKEKVPNRPQLATVDDIIAAYNPTPQPKGKR